MSALLQVPGFDLAAVGPEAVLAAGGLALLVGGTLVRRPHLMAGAALAVLAAAAAVAVGAGGRRAVAFDGTILLDGFATFLKVLLAAAAAVSVVVAARFVHREGGPPTELFGLIVLGTAGMMLMASAGDLILIFLALETFSLALYVLAAFRRRRLDSQEAALKYFLTGSFSSAFLLYGIALVYGATGSTRLLAVAERLSSGVPDRALVVAGLALVLVGLAFKVAAVPFHNWTPDAYQGSPAPVAGFMAAGSKVAGFAALLRVTTAAFPGLAAAWRPAVAALAVASMVVGSLVAIAQSNVKRMLAYSAIAHSGFLLLGVTAANPRGLAGSLFYLAVYAFVIVGAFAIVYAVGGAGEEHLGLDAYRGLWARQPFLAAALAVLLLSLAGIPPTAGFWAKFEIFSAAAAAGQVPLVVVGVLASAVAAFFYLRVIALMFLEAPPEWGGGPDPTPPAAGLAALLGAAVVALAGLAPEPLLDLARKATILAR